MEKVDSIKRPVEYSDKYLRLVEDYIGERTEYGGYVLRVVNYMFSGQTWDVDLKEDLQTDESYYKFLDTVQEVIDLCEEGGGERWNEFFDGIIDLALERIKNNYWEADLYLAMVDDLLGEEGAKVLINDLNEWAGEGGIEEDMFINDEEAEEFIKDAREFYERVVGKTIWEWEEEDLLSGIGVGVRVMVVFEGEVDESEIGDDLGMELPEAVKEEYSRGATKRLQELLGAAIGRGIIKEKGKVVLPGVEGEISVDFLEEMAGW